MNIFIYIYIYIYIFICIYLDISFAVHLKLVTTLLTGYTPYSIVRAMLLLLLLLSRFSRVRLCVTP